MKKIIENRILRIATLLDPRFAYDEELWTKGRWGHIEEQLIDFAIEVMKPCEGDTNNNEETFSSAAIVDLSMDYELDLDEAEKSDESIK
uniref:Uncharacterized protein n=1 Tax=Acrobeloides nanus TaxID=290746 RepID=A0A914ESF1_9BILA